MLALLILLTDPYGIWSGQRKFLSALRSSSQTGKRFDTVLHKFISAFGVRTEGSKFTLAVSTERTGRQTDGRQTVTLRFPLDASSVIICDWYCLWNYDLKNGIQKVRRLIELVTRYSMYITSSVGLRWVPAKVRRCSAAGSKGGMAHSIRGWTWWWQIKLWSLVNTCHTRAL